MGKYVIKRLVYFIPGIFLISLAVFFLSRSFQNDPIADYLYNERGVSNTQYAYRDYMIGIPECRFRT